MSIVGLPYTLVCPYVIFYNTPPTTPAPKYGSRCTGNCQDGWLGWITVTRKNPQFTFIFDSPKLIPIELKSCGGKVCREVPPDSICSCGSLLTVLLQLPFQWLRWSNGSFWGIFVGQDRCYDGFRISSSKLLLQGIAGCFQHNNGMVW